VDRHISSDPHEAVEVIQALVEQLHRQRWDDVEVFGIHLSLEEAIANAICHGNANNRDKSIRVKLETSVDTFYAQITDEGPGFDPKAIPDPTDDENLERPCGRGLKLMRCYMDEVAYCSTGNSVELFKKRSKNPPDADADPSADS
jgi:serine/threonine-protein kinase RsbW